MADLGDLAAPQPNPVWVKFDPEADAAYIGLASISPGEAVRQIIVVRRPVKLLMGRYRAPVGPRECA